MLKLVSGLMMLGLGSVLLVDPALLNNPFASAAAGQPAGQVM